MIYAGAGQCVSLLVWWYGREEAIGDERFWRPGGQQEQEHAGGMRIARMLQRSLDLVVEGSPAPAGDRVPACPPPLIRPAPGRLVITERDGRVRLSYGARTGRYGAPFGFLFWLLQDGLARPVRPLDQFPLIN